SPDQLFGYDRCGAQRPVPGARTEWPLSVWPADLRREGRQGGRSAETGRWQCRAGTEMLNRDVRHLKTVMAGYRILKFRTKDLLAAGSRHLVEQRLRLFEISRIEAFGEPAVDRGEEVAGSLRRPCSPHSLARLVAARSSQSLASCSTAMAR